VPESSTLLLLGLAGIQHRKSFGSRRFGAGQLVRGFGAVMVRKRRVKK